MDDSVTLGDARAWLRRRAAMGAQCPCCRQYTKVYRRKLNGSMARVLVEFYRHELRWPRLWHQVFDVLNPIGYHGADYGKLTYWGLLESNDEQVGYWRITPLGIRFVRREQKVPSHAVVYDGRVLRTDGGPVSITDVLPRTFDYAELMAERPESGEPR